MTSLTARGSLSASLTRLRRATSAASASAASPPATLSPATATPPACAYVHIPFCRRRCFYCDFPIHVVGDGGGAAPGVRAYVDAVCADVAAARPGPPLRTVSFGGGTPSLLPASELGRVLEALTQRFSLAPGCEVSLEADPGTFDAAKLDAWLQLGVNRISLGVQSFDAGVLAGAGRAHSAADAAAALALVRASGVRSWGLDLIAGLPHLTHSLWLETLAAAVRSRLRARLPVSHSIKDVRAAAPRLRLRPAGGAAHRLRPLVHPRRAPPAQRGGSGGHAARRLRRAPRCWLRA